MAFVSDFIEVLEAGIDFDLATAAFTQDGGDPWNIVATERAFLVRPVDLLEAVRETQAPN